MSAVITPRDLVDELLRISKELDSAHDHLVQASRQAADTERDYRKMRATAYVRIQAKTVGEREAQVDLMCNQERHEAHLAEALKVAALEKVRSLRAQLSAAQSIASSVRVEAELAGRYST